MSDCETQIRITGLPDMEDAYHSWPARPPASRFNSGDFVRELMYPLGILSLLVSVYCSVKVLPGPPSITNHAVVLTKFEEAEHVEGIEGQCLIVKAERKAVVAVECMRPAKLGIDHHRIGTLRPHALE